MPTTIREYVLNDVNEPPDWSARERQLFEDIIDKLPDNDKTYVNDQHFHGVLVVPDTETERVICSAGAVEINNADLNVDQNADVTGTITGRGIYVGGSNNELRFYEGANYVGFEAPALAADQIWVLPNADGGAGEILKTDGAGNLGWIAAGAAAAAGADTQIQYNDTGSLGAEAAFTYDNATNTMNVDNALIDLSLQVGAFGSGPVISSAAGVLSVLADPGADRIVFWDDSDSAIEYLAPNTGLGITGNNLNVTATYTTISGNDGDTDVTGAELETLTDGSDADALHVHSMASLNDVSLADPGADHIVFWDDSDSQFEFLVPNTGLSVTGNNLNVSLSGFSLDDLGSTSLADPGVDRIVFWDDSDNQFEFLTANTGLGITANNLNVTATYSTISGNDGATDVTGAELETLTDTSNADALHAHDHDSLTNFVANEHIDHTSVTLTAGNGLSGGGDISANRTFAVDLNELGVEAAIAAGDYIAMVDVTDNGSQKITFANFESTLNHDSLSGFVGNEHVDHTAVTLTAGNGLTGGGDISANRTFAVGAGNGITVNANDVAIDTTDLSDGYVPFWDNGNSRFGDSGIYWDDGNSRVGVGVVVPLAYMDITGSRDAKHCLQLRSGDSIGSSDASQIILSYNGNPYNSSGFAHSIRTMHDAAAAANNRIDFWLWDQTTDAGGDLGTLNVMSIKGDGVVQLHEYGAGILHSDASGNITSSTVDISADTNLAAGTGLALSGDTMAIDTTDLSDNYVPFWDNGNSRFGDSGIYWDGTNVGIGTDDPQTNLDVSGNQSSDYCLQLRCGDSSGETDSAQIILSYNSNPYNSSGFAHSIRTMHDAAAAANNRIDFWLWDQTTDTSNTLGTLRVLGLLGDGTIQLNQYTAGILHSDASGNITSSTVDISADTNLAANTGLTLSGDTVQIDTTDLSDNYIPFWDNGNTRFGDSGAYWSTANSALWLGTASGGNAARLNIWDDGDQGWLYLRNTTQTDSDLGRVVTINVTGERSGGETATQGQLQWYHTGAADDDSSEMVVKVGNAAGGVTSMLYIDENSLLIPDDKKLYFGDGNEFLIEYDEDSSDCLRLNGADVWFDGVTARWSLSGVNDHTIKDDSGVFAINSDAEIELRKSGSAVLEILSVIADTGARIVDDNYLWFGNGNDGFAFYDEASSDEFIIGTAANTDMRLYATSGTIFLGSGSDGKITFDGNDVNGTAWDVATGSNYRHVFVNATGQLCIGSTDAALNHS